MNKIFFLGFFLLTFSISGQRSLNGYKLIVVDEKLDFFKKKDQYKTASLTKFLFNKYGFTAYLNSEDLPEEIINNRCSALFASMVKVSSMFSTKVKVVLKDCNGKLVYTSISGNSKLKEYKYSYHEALRKTFLDPSIKYYKYVPQKSVVNNNKIASSSNEIKEIVEVKKQLVVKKEKTPVLNNNGKKVEVNATNVLYAQVKNNGFQLVDVSPKVVFEILKTTQTNVFVIKDKNGILYKVGANWIAEFYENGRLIKKTYQIKF